MSLVLYAENNDGDVVAYPARVKEDTLDVSIHAAEASVGSSVITIDDPDGDFYIRGLKPLYLVETDAITDDWFGVVGLFYAWNRVFRRGPYRSGASREVDLHVNDLNTLLTRRLQKGTDAQRPQETDVERMTWLVGTAEVIGGGGDSGFSIEDTDFLFTDSTYPMDKTDYTGQDSSGVINDALQDSGKNSFLFVSPLEDEPIRVGIWYGRTERTDYSSAHRISNVFADVNIDAAQAAFNETPEDLIAGEWTFFPSLDASLDRDPSRVASGIMVQRDGGYAYETRPATAEAFERRDMLMQAELVKTQAQAVRRARRYLRDLRNEDDAIECAVIVPSALVNAFREGHRVQVKFSHLPGYASGFVWMRVASRTVRQIAADSLLYELALDLRAEEPPDSDTTGSGEACSGLTSSGSFYPLGGTDDTPNASDGHVYYHNPGEPKPITVEEMTGEVGHWHFPDYGAGGTGTTDFAGDCAQNSVRCMVVGSGTMTIHTSVFGPARTMRWRLSHHRYDDPGDPTSGVDILDNSGTFALGSDVEISVSTHGDTNCTHWVDVSDVGGTCGSKWGFDGFDWDAA